MTHHRTLITASATRRLLVVVLCLASVATLAPSTGFAQNPAYAFATSIGGAEYDESTAIALDASDNLYVTGRFRGTVDFDPGTGTANLTSAPYAGWGDIFVASYDAAGNYRWAFNVGGPPPTGMSADNIGLAIAIDGNDNVVVSGLFNGTMDFDPGVGTRTLSGNGWATFVAKYTSTGSYLWAFQIGPYSSGNDLAVDASGNVIVVGTFKGTVDFNPGSGTNTLSSTRTGPKNSTNNTVDVFVAKYSATGAYQWAFRVGNASAETADAVDVDGNGNVYLTGQLNSTAIDFDPGKNTASLTGPGIYVARYTGGGAYVRAFKLGSASLADGIEVDGSGNVVVTGGFNGTVDFDPGAGTATLTSRGIAGKYDIYVARYDATGAYQWAFSPALGNAPGIEIDGSGNIHLTGWLTGANDFDPGSGVAELDRDPAYDQAAFVASYTAMGAHRWAFSIPTPGTIGAGIASRGDDLYVTGRYNVTADFDPGVGVASQTSAGRADVFIAKYTEASLLPKSIAAVIGASALQASPNPFTNALTVRFETGDGPARVDVLDLTGRVVESFEGVDAGTGIMIGADLPAGTYVVRLAQGATRRQVIVRKLE